MACNSKLNTLNHLRQMGLLNEKRVVPIAKLQEFRKLNQQYLDYAKREYGVQGETMFEIEKKKDGVGNTIYRATPVEEIFSQIDSELAERERIIREDTMDFFPQFDGVSENVMPKFEKYLSYKLDLKRRVDARLNQLRIDKKKFASDPARLKAILALENELKTRLKGSQEENIIGLEAEIAELQDAGSLDRLIFYAQRDFERLDKLVESINEQDLTEARTIVNFYKAVGTFTTKENHPIFDQADLFNENGDSILNTETKEALESLKEQAETYDNKIYQKEKAAIEEAVNTNRKVQALYGDKKFTHDELFFKDTGLKDSSWVDMFMMDITNGILSHNGIMPQVMMNTIQNAFEDHLVYAKSVEERVAAIQEQVESELRKMGYGIKVPGLKGVSYDIFRAINSDGQFEDGVTQRYTSSFADAKIKMEKTFSQKIKAAQLEEDADKRAEMFAEAYNIRDNWHRKNTIVIDPSKLMEVINSEDFAQFKTHFNEAASEAYTNNLKELLGEQGYQEEVNKQIKLLKEYKTMLEVFKENVIAEAGVESYNELKEEDLNKIDLWEKRNNPFTMVESYRSGKPITKGNFKLNSTMQYNYAVPRKTQTKLKATAKGVVVEDTTLSTGFYDERFQTIEANSVLKEFHSLLMEVNQKIFDTLPPEMRKKFSANSIPALQKSFVEIMFDPNMSFFQRISTAARALWEKIIGLFGMNAQSNLSYASVDPITGQPQYKINSQFLQGNKEVINNRYLQELLRFKQAQGLSATTRIGKFDTIDLNKATAEAIAVIAEALNVEPSVSAILKKLPTANASKFELARYLKSGITHQIVAENSLDLPKIMKLYSYLTMEYAARQEVLPFMEMAKRHYEEMKSPVTSNTGSSLVNARNSETRLEGERARANKQMDSWFHRVVLGNYASKEVWNDPRIKRSLDVGLTGVEKIDTFTEKFRPKISGRIYTKEEKAQKRRLEEVLDNLKKEVAQAEAHEAPRLNALINNVENQLENLGKHFSRVAAADAIFNFIRFKGLGWNLSSSVTNFMEGQIANFTVAATGDYFKPENIYAANTILKESFLKNATFGKVATGKAKKAAILMERYRILQDASNELQKASSKSAFSRADYLSPYVLTQRVEYLNQTPLMIARLMDEMITGKDGTQSSVWDAMQSDGTLSENFATEENKKNWEEADGQMYQDFASTMKKMIVNAHGDYDELRGNMATEYTLGKAVLMFKRWMARQFYQRFGADQMDLEVGVKDFKGRYRSHTNASGALHGMIVGATVLGPLGALGGGLAGATVANFYGSKSELGFIQEMTFNLKELGLTMLRMPINSLMGKEVIKTNDYQKLRDAGVSERDIRNMQSNMVDMSVVLGFLAMLLFTKALLWDDEDEDDDLRRQMHNLLANRAMQLSGQSAMYLDPVEMYDSTVGDLAFFKFLSDVFGFADKTIGLLSGDDTYTTGAYAGESKWWRQFNKTFVPSLIKPGFGFESQMKKQYEESHFDDYFKSYETKAQEETKRIRAEYRSENSDRPTEEVEKELKDKFPPKKEGQTYVELLELYESNM